MIFDKIMYFWPISGIFLTIAGICQKCRFLTILVHFYDFFDNFDDFSRTSHIFDHFLINFRQVSKNWHWFTSFYIFRTFFVNSGIFGPFSLIYNEQLVWASTYKNNPKCEIFLKIWVFIKMSIFYQNNYLD